MSLQHIEAELYEQVGDFLRDRGHHVVHLVYSRNTARRLRAHGQTAICMLEEMDRLPAFDAEAQARRIAAEYPVPTFRDIYRTDFLCDGASEAWCVDRTVRHVLVTERVFADHAPDVIVPEVGNETIRTVAHLVGLRHGAPVLFLFYTIFPDPLRLYVDTMHAPIVRRDQLVELGPMERRRLDAFVEEFIARDAPIRAYRRTEISSHRLAIIFKHLAVKRLVDSDNGYLRPARWLAAELRDAIRARRARGLYSDLAPGRPFLYFPLHVMDDYKLKRVIPHCANQVGLIEQVARALPHGYDLVVKEHPMSIGRNSLQFLRSLARMRNVRIVPPKTGSHALIAQSRGVVVISSTVGLEALLHGKPVMTLGQPFYSGFGVTLDIDNFADIRASVPRLVDAVPDPELTRRFLHAAMQACRPGAPMLVDRSRANAANLAGSVEAAALEELERRGACPAAASRSVPRVPDGP